MIVIGGFFFVGEEKIQLFSTKNRLGFGMHAIVVYGAALRLVLQGVTVSKQRERGKPKFRFLKSL